jgi:hypothetical protein
MKAKMLGGFYFFSAQKPGFWYHSYDFAGLVGCNYPNMNFESFDSPHFGGCFVLCKGKSTLMGVMDIPKMKRLIRLSQFAQIGPWPHILGMSLTTTITTHGL